MVTDQSSFQISLSLPLCQAVRELGLLSSPASRPSVDQANSELKALQFRAVTDYNRLRDGVARLGSDADTVRARQQLSSFSQSFRDLAVEFKQKVASHPARDAASTQKLIRDFQVRRGPGRQGEGRGLVERGGLSICACL